MQSLGRSVGAQIIVDEVLASCSGGPRGNEQLRSLLTFVRNFCDSSFLKCVFAVLTLRCVCFDVNEDSVKGFLFYGTLK